MSERHPELARASPNQEPNAMKLNVRFSQGGEFIHWEKIDLVDETEIINESHTDAPDVSPPEESQNSPATMSNNNKKISGSVSTMLLLQIATLAISIIALIIAL